MIFLAKLLDFVLGKIIEEVILIHEALSLSHEEKQIIKNYAGKPNHLLTKDKATDELIRKLLAAMSTNNRAELTIKGEKLKKILSRYHI